MILTIYDLSGIQSFIFSNSKLKTTVGASEIVHKCLFENIPELDKLNCKDGDWKNEKTLGSSGTRIVYIGGGNAVMMFNSKEESDKFTEELAKKIITDTGGTLRLISATVEINEEAKDTEKLSEVWKKLYDELDKNKKNTAYSVPFGGFSLNAQDNETFEPIIMVEDGENIKYFPRSKYLKLKAYKKLIKEIEGNKKSDDVHFSTEFEKFHKDGKNFIAVIHIDGNTMGKAIRAYNESLTGKLSDCLFKLRQMSVKISALYNSVLDETIAEIYEKYKETHKQQEIEKNGFLFRKIISDGDDITVICAAELALDFSEMFLTKLEKSAEDESKKIENYTPTAAAGIAFVGIKFPYYDAYNIAEALVKNAKKKTLERMGDEKPYSSIDWQIMYGGIAEDIAEFRRENYQLDDNTFLNIRPYIFTKPENPYAYELFIEKKDKINALLEKGFSRGKLKKLRNAYGMGFDSAENYGEFIKSREQGGKFEKQAEELSEVFQKTDGKTYAKWFDVLDIMDFDIATQEEKVNDVSAEN
ncbi:MAG: hypothetical protein LBM93_05850 [Oscillospiraceae bacterium]|nr:hypothetical protein [Oscillospiraceae bacterium]